MLRVTPCLLGPWTGAIPALVLDEMRADMRHYEDAGGYYKSRGFWVTATYRFGHWARSISSTPARLFALGVYKAAALPFRFLWNVSIPATAKIGPGLCLHHPFNILIPATASIGDDCTIYHDVVLGLGPHPGVPTLGNNVTIFAGAKIIGGIKIGDGAEIGANVVVSRDIESGAVVPPMPARVIPREMRDFMRYRREAAG